MIVLNFSHPITEEQIIDLRKVVGSEEMVDVRDIPIQLDQEKPFQAQIFDILVDCSLVRLDWEKVYVFLPGLAIAAVIIVDELKKLTSELQVVRLKSEKTPFSIKFSVAEIVRI